MAQNDLILDRLLHCPDDPNADPESWTFWDLDGECYVFVPKWFTDDMDTAARMALWVDGMCGSAFGRGQRVGREGLRIDLRRLINGEEEV